MDTSVSHSVHQHNYHSQSDNYRLSRGLNNCNTGNSGAKSSAKQESHSSVMPVLKAVSSDRFGNKKLVLSASDVNKFNWLRHTNPQLVNSCLQNTVSSQFSLMTEHSNRQPMALLQQQTPIFTTESSLNSNSRNLVVMESGSSRQNHQSMIAAAVTDGFMSPKPDYTYSQLIFMAIEASPRKQLRVSAIYQWIATNFPQFCNPATNWRNSIRHNLSLHKAFVKLDALGGKSSLWTVDNAWREAMLRGLRKAGSGHAGPNVGRLRIPISSGITTIVDDSNSEIMLSSFSSLNETPSVTFLLTDDQSVLDKTSQSESTKRRPRKSALVLRRTGEVSEDSRFRGGNLVAGRYRPPLTTSLGSTVRSMQTSAQHSSLDMASVKEDYPRFRINTNTAPLFSCSTHLKEIGTKHSENTSIGQLALEEEEMTSSSEASEGSIAVGSVGIGGRRRQQSLTMARDLVAMACGSISEYNVATKHSPRSDSESLNPFELLLQAASAIGGNVAPNTPTRQHDMHEKKSESVFSP